MPQMMPMTWILFPIIMMSIAVTMSIMNTSESMVKNLITKKLSKTEKKWTW